MSKSDDLISRQVAIDALTRKMVSIPTAGEKDLMGDVNRIRTEDISVIRRLPSAQPELIEKIAYIRGFEQGRTQGMIDSQGWRKAMRAIDGDALRDRLQNLAYEDWNQGATIT